jgi:lipoprotein-anchoring transpeptidase ErfK/SrfK
LKVVRRASWILVPILAAGCSGEGVDPAAKQEPKKHAAQKSAAPAQVPRAQPVPKPLKPRPKNKPRAKKPKPRQHWHLLPWRPDGTTSVAYVQSRVIRVYGSPRAKRPLFVLRRRDPRGTQRTFLVRAERGEWIRVYLPTRPNGSLGWVRRRAVQLYVNPYRLVVRLKRHRLQLWRGRELVAKYPVAVGTSSTPTPRGMFYVVELLKPHDPNGSYGPYSFGISAHSQVLKTFAGGDGRVGVHGTNQPDLIGSNISHGCIRLRNEPIRQLARILPLGTPVYIRS